VLGAVAAFLYKNQEKYSSVGVVRIDPLQQAVKAAAAVNSQREIYEQ